MLLLNYEASYRRINFKHKLKLGIDLKMKNQSYSDLCSVPGFCTIGPGPLLPYVKVYCLHGILFGCLLYDLI